MASPDLSPEQRGITDEVVRGAIVEISSAPQENFIQYFTRVAREGHTKEERDRISETERRLRQELPRPTGEIDHLRMTW